MGCSLGPSSPSLFVSETLSDRWHLCGVGTALFENALEAQTKYFLFLLLLHFLLLTGLKLAV